MSADEKPPLMMMRRSQFLMPLGPIDGEVLERLPSNKPLKVRVTQPRSLAQHRLYWAMLSLVCDNLDQPVTPEALHEWVKLRCGVSVQIRLKSGAVDTIPGSIAFDKMDQATFRTFFDKAVTLIAYHIIPGLNKVAVEREAMLMLGAPA